MFSRKEYRFVLAVALAIVFGICADVVRAALPMISMSAKVVADQPSAESGAVVWFRMMVTNKGNLPLKVTANIASKQDGVAGLLPMVLETNVKFVTGTQVKGSAVWRFRLPAKTTRTFRFLVRISAKQEYCLHGNASAALKFGGGAKVKINSFNEDCIAVS